MELSITTVSFEFVQLDRCGQLSSRQAGQARQAVEHLGRGVQLLLNAVPAGSFRMGSYDEGSYPDERPLQVLSLAGYWLGVYPVTQAQWQAVMGERPDCRFHGAELPVENINWQQAAVFCSRLTAQTGRRYRLPSEAEWEYACRAGTCSAFSSGETITTDYANYSGAQPYGAGPPGIYRHSTTPVGSFPPNPWGFYDMHGNVWEFCRDRWGEQYAPDDEQIPGKAVSCTEQLETERSAGASPETGSSGPLVYRATRGGSWHEPAVHCRSAMRLRVAEYERIEYYGLRVLLPET
ncbi:MAG: formylglycine-generating enzyme family protein [Anaerolineae bacterium]